MADTTPAGPVNHVLPVTFDQTTHSLVCAREEVSVKAGDTVVWTFFGVPEGYAPYVQFRPGQTDGSPLGPLESLHQTDAGVWGTCRTDLAPGTFAYRAVLQKGHLRSWDNDGSSLWSRIASLIIVPPTSGEEKTFTIQPDSTGNLSVTPQLREIKGTDTVLWSFEDLPSPPPGASGWLPRVTFFQYQGDGEVPNLQLGPFTSLITGATQVQGTGNTDVVGFYSFEVALVSAVTGEVTWVSSSDPVIDNRGTVIGPD